MDRVSGPAGGGFTNSDGLGISCFGGHAYIRRHFFRDPAFLIFRSANFSKSIVPKALTPPTPTHGQTTGPKASPLPRLSSNPRPVLCGRGQPVDRFGSPPLVVFAREPSGSSPARGFPPAVSATAWMRRRFRALRSPQADTPGDLCQGRSRPYSSIRIPRPA